MCTDDLTPCVGLLYCLGLQPGPVAKQAGAALTMNMRHCVVMVADGAAKANFY
jgi:hypothetical protein